MFTGIIEEVGTVTSIKKTPTLTTLTISCKTVLEDVSIGDSISVNGVCLTVEAFNTSSFKASIMNQTMKHTLFKTLKTKDKVNLERAMSLHRRFGGHYVSGHVDTLGRVRRIHKSSHDVQYMIQIPHTYTKYIVEKGSITVNGISLTVFDVRGDFFKISLIPETLKQTNLTEVREGHQLHIECDIVAKYIERMVQHNE